MLFKLINNERMFDDWLHILYQSNIINIFFFK